MDRRLKLADEDVRRIRDDRRRGLTYAECVVAARARGVVISESWARRLCVEPDARKGA